MAISDTTGGLVDVDVRADLADAAPPVVAADSLAPGKSAQLALELDPGCWKAQEVVLFVLLPDQSGSPVALSEPPGQNCAELHRPPAILYQRTFFSPG